MSPGMLTSYTPGHLIEVVRQYAAEVADGHNLKSLTDLSDTTILNYTISAVTWIRCITGTTVPLYTNINGKEKPHPCFSAYSPIEGSGTKNATYDSFSLAPYSTP
jgi:hypothetical protein